MTVETDADRLAMLADFGLDVVLIAQSRTIKAFLDRDASQFDAFSGVTLIDREPLLFARSVDLVGVEQKDKLTAEGITWEVVEILPKAEGGYTELRLRKEGN